LTILHQITVGNKLKDYYELTKPKIWYLLVFTAFGAALTASFLFDIPITPLTWMLLLGGVAAGSAAADTLTGYNDRDIDAIMERTKNRPIPSGRISPRNALIFGLILAAISLACSWFINIWAFGLMAFGLGGFSGGAPALIGYIAVTTQNIEIGLVMAGLVFLWIPTHIWSLALHVKKDYAKAGVPMLPVVSSEKSSVRVIAGTTLMMVVFSVLPFFFNHFGMIYLVTASAFGVAMIMLSIWLLVRPSEKASWTVFKFSSPYLTALFIAFIIDAFFK
jgi:protoheme IX farnesyltransferase